MAASFDNILNDRETTEEEFSEDDVKIESEGEVVVESYSEPDSEPEIAQKLPSRTKKRARDLDEDWENDERPNVKKRKSSSSLSKVLSRGQNPMTWSLKEPRGPSATKTESSFHLPQVVGEAKKAKTPLAAWSYLIDTNITNAIVINTNAEIQRVTRASKNRQTYHKETDDIEIRAVIGLLYAAGSKKQNCLDIDELWGDDYAPNIYRATMSANRFQFLIKCLRFDDKTSRVGRRKYDRYTAIRDVWSRFIDNCAAYYSPYQICTIGEQMVGFKGTCTFRVFVPSKRERYGIRYVLITDAKTNYMFSAMPCLGKITDNVFNEPIGNYYVRKLVETIRGSGRTVLTYNTFTSVSLYKILKDEYKLKSLGPIRKNKGEVPDLFLEKAPFKSSRYGFSGDLTLLSYTPKDNQVILMLSNGIKNTGIDQATGKPQLIAQYNLSKLSTDAFDHACRTYTVTKRTRRWPLKVFFSILDKANVNATILYNLIHIDKKKNRKEFQKELSFALIKPLLKRRYECAQLRTSIKKTLEVLLDIKKPIVVDAIVMSKRSRCHYCHHSLGIKTKMKCPVCDNAMCTRHRSPLCVACMQTDSI